MDSHLALMLVAIIVLGAAAQWLAWWLRQPAIVFLLAIGLIVGPVTGWLNPDELLGKWLFTLISLGVAVILFEGSLTLQLDEVRGHGSVVRNLVTIGAAITAVIAAMSAHMLLGMSKSLSALFGAIVCVSGPTVVVPLLRSVRPKTALGAILRWEGILIDPIGALLAVLVYEFLIVDHHQESVQLFIKAVVVGVLAGLIGALLLGHALRKHWLPEYLINVVSLATVLGVFVASNMGAEESGLIAVTIMGIVLANRREIRTDEILHFKESLSVLLISTVFLVLSARVDLNQLIRLGWRGLAVLGIVMFVARPLAVWASTIGSRLSVRDRALLAWIGPRGIIAASVSSLFAIRLENLGIEGAELLQPLTFLVIIGTVVLASATGRPMANWLRVSEPATGGVLFVGANAAARAIAKSLADQGMRVVLIDPHWEDIRAARMQGLETFLGEAVSEKADRSLDLFGLDHLFAMSDRAGQNTLSVLRYRPDFGSAHVFAIRTPEERNLSEKHQVVADYRSRRLFGEDVNLPKLVTRVNEGWEVRSTTLTANFNYEAYRAQHGENSIPLFAIDPRRRLHVFSSDSTVKPEVGWTVVSLLPPKPKSESHSGKFQAVEPKGDEPVAPLP